LKNKLYLPGLLGLRFIAAFTVYFGHLEQAIDWARLPIIPAHTSPAMPNDGVTFFFVLSGFLIT
jgi:peptidoglycan/LPS O-acetylase OafA/YrhL